MINGYSLYIHLHKTLNTSFSRIIQSLIVTNNNLRQQFTDTLNIYPSPVYQVLNVNWSTFLKGILPTLQSNSWNNGTHGGCQLGSGDLDLLPLFMWPIGVSLTTLWVLWLLMGVPNESFCHLPSHPAPPPIPPTCTLYYQY